MKIAYNSDNGLNILTSCMPYIDIKILAEKDVPSGLYYKIIQDSDLPSRETRNFWTMEINENNADGIGLTKEEFIVKYPQYKDWAVQ